MISGPHYGWQRRLRFSDTSSCSAVEHNMLTCHALWQIMDGTRSPLCLRWLLGLSETSSCSTLEHNMVKSAYHIVTFLTYTSETRRIPKVPCYDPSAGMEMCLVVPFSRRECRRKH
ncbi:uncharacterized protein LOC135366268 [Ornithodoros turicata]|uniref:uncharacterized protein LOC135366268 n=1 Tax=Ornithodoros turicata TaxID=34597 RepID=UPI003139F3B8